MVAYFPNRNVFRNVWYAARTQRRIEKSADERRQLRGALLSSQVGNGSERHCLFGKDEIRVVTSSRSIDLSAVGSGIPMGVHWMLLDACAPPKMSEC